MIMKPLYLLAILFLIISCKDTQNKEKETFYQIKESECSAQIFNADTSFLFNNQKIDLMLRGECEDQVAFYDTITDKNQDTTSVTEWKESILKVVFHTRDTTNNITIEKGLFSKVLDDKFLKRSLLQMPKKIAFDTTSGTIRFESFIGYPNSKSGRSVEFEISNDGKLIVNPFPKENLAL